MFQDFMPGLSTFTMIAVVLSVVLSEVVLRAIDGFNHKYEKNFLLGARFLVPLLVAGAFALVSIKTEGLPMSFFFRDCAIIYGYATVLYELIAKRIFGTITLKLTPADVEAGTGSDPAVPEDKPKRKKGGKKSKAVVQVDVNVNSGSNAETSGDNLGK